MGKQWVSKRKLVSLNETEARDLETYSKKAGRTETEIIREALRLYLANKKESSSSTHEVL